VGALVWYASDEHTVTSAHCVLDVELHNACMKKPLLQVLHAEQTVLAEAVQEEEAYVTPKVHTWQEAHTVSLTELQFCVMYLSLLQLAQAWQTVFDCSVQA
jgi:hypothetical protein